MNDLYKTKKVLLGLKKHPSYSCKSCPYNGNEYCTSHLMEDAFDVIAAQKEMMNRKEVTKATSGFITLTTGVVSYCDNKGIWTDTNTFAVRVDDILIVRDSENFVGSEIELKSKPETVIFVQETIEEILARISKGE